MVETPGKHTAPDSSEPVREGNETSTTCVDQAPHNDIAPGDVSTTHIGRHFADADVVALPSTYTLREWLIARALNGNASPELALRAVHTFAEFNPEWELDGDKRTWRDWSRSIARGR